MPRRDYSKVAFAAIGDTHIIPDAVQPDGSVSLAAGWPFDYQRDNGAGGGTPDPLAKNITREDMNGILNEATASIGEIQQSGVPSYAASAAPYPIYAIVRSADKIWQSVIANNSSPPSAPDWRDVSNLASVEVVNASLPFRGSISFTAPGTTSWTVPTGVTKVYVTVIGGGGGGGKRDQITSQGAGGGGGGGGYAEGVLSVTPGASIPIVVGAGGIGATARNNAGSAGGSSSFFASIAATGGGGGGVNNGATGGVGSGGQINTSTGIGGAGFSFSNSTTADAGVTGSGGGAGGNGIVFNSSTPSTNGFSAIGPGGGGGGALYNGNAGNGSPGLVQIKW